MSDTVPSREGVVLAPGFDTHLERMRHSRAQVKLPGLAGVRWRYDDIGEQYSQTYQRPAGLRVRNTFIVKQGHEIPLRVYRSDVGRTPPVIVYFHGGGWVAGSHDSHEMTISELAHATGAAVVSVHYRRAPENPYPAMHEDAYDAVLWAVEMAELYGWDANRLAVAGDSAGGLLSTAMCIMAKKRNGPRIRHQSLLYGVYDTNADRPYYRTAKDETLTLEGVNAYARAYLGGRTDIADPEAIPARAKTEDLIGLPPAYFLNAEYDFLLEEELEYAALLRAANVPVVVDTIPGTMHGLLRAMDVCVPVREAFGRLVADIMKHIG